MIAPYNVYFVEYKSRRLVSKVDNVETIYANSRVDATKQLLEITKKFYPKAGIVEDYLVQNNVDENWTGFLWWIAAVRPSE